MGARFLLEKFVEKVVKVLGNVRSNKSSLFVFPSFSPFLGSALELLF